MRSVAVLLLLCAFAVDAEDSSVKSAGLDIATESEYGAVLEPDWDISPGECDSKLYRWTGSSFVCLRTRRILTLKLQRDNNKKAWEACRAELAFVRADKSLQALYASDRESCRDQGRTYDENEALCGDPLPPVPKLPF